MASKVWRGTASVGSVNDWDNDGANGNWKTTSGVDTTKPATGDVIVLTGAVDISEGLTQTGVAPSELHINEDYTGNIGSAGNYLTFHPTSLISYVYYSGTGTNYLSWANSRTSISGTGSSGKLFYKIPATDTFGVFWIIKGDVDITGTDITKTLFHVPVGYIDNPLGDVTLTIGQNAFISYLMPSGGTIDVDGGRVLFLFNAGADITLTNVTANPTLAFLSGGITRLIDPSAVPTALFVSRDAVFDASEVTGEFNLGTAVMMRDGIIDIADGTASIGASYLAAAGGTLKTDRGHVVQAFQREL